MARERPRSCRPPRRSRRRAWRGRPGRRRTCSRSTSSRARSLRSRPPASTSSIASAASATSASIAPRSLTWAKSRTRLSSRLATRGVPRERSAIVCAPSASISTPRIPAERTMISRQVLGRVVLEPVREAEAVAQRRRQQAGPGGRADQGEGRQRQGDRAGPGALAEHDRQLAVLHRRVERLLDRPPEPVDLIDEEDAARLQRGEEGGDVGLALQRRAGGLHQRHAHLLGDDVGQRGLAEAGRAGEQHVVERLFAPARGLDEDRQLLGDLLLVDEIGQGAADAASGRGPRRVRRRGRRGRVRPRAASRRRRDGPSIPGVRIRSATTTPPTGRNPRYTRRFRPVGPHEALRDDPALRRAAASSSSASSPSIPSSSCSASSGA